MACFVYVLTNPADRIYIGQTDDLPHRLDQHSDPEDHPTAYTKRYRGPWRVIDAESLPNREAALHRRSVPNHQARLAVEVGTTLRGARPVVPGQIYATQCLAHTQFRLVRSGDA